MKIEKEKLDRLSEIVKKHVPKVLTPEGVALMVLECTIGPNIAMLIKRLFRRRDHKHFRERGS